MSDIVGWAQAQIAQGERAILDLLQQMKRAPVAEAYAFDALIKRHGWTVARIAQHTGMTVRFVQMRLQLLRLPAPALAGVSAGQVQIRTARAMVQTPRAAVKPPPSPVRATYEPVIRVNPLAPGEHLLCIRRPDGVVVDRYPVAPAALKALAAEIMALPPREKAA